MPFQLLRSYSTFKDKSRNCGNFEHPNWVGTLVRKMMNVLIPFCLSGGGLSLYWYVSPKKVEMLKGYSRFSNLKDLSITLNAMWLEVSASFQVDDKLETDVKNVERKVGPNAEAFERLANNEPPVVFSFAAEAARMLDAGAFWMASKKNESALLLVGSASNAIGGPDKTGAISPSADPLGACKVAFQGGESTSPMSVSSSLTYVWNTVMRTSEGAISLPRVEGLAVFAGIFKVEGSMTGVAVPARLILGSPVFIRQT